MTPLPLADWQASLDEMETTLTATLAALDNYQTGWQHVLAESPPEFPRHGGLLERLDLRLREWDARLAAAAELAASVERELNDREAAVGRWQESFTGWREVIQRGGEPHTPS